MLFRSGLNGQVLYGNGVFAVIPTVTTVQNANSVQSNTSAATTAYLMSTTTSANGYVATFKSTGITANLAANTITATGFVGTVQTGVQPSITQLTNTNLQVYNRTISGSTGTPRYIISTLTQDSADNLETSTALKIGRAHV